MADTSTLAVTFDKPSYVQGEKMTLRFVGTITRETSSTVSDVEVTFVSSDGTPTVVDAASATVTSVKDMAPKVSKVSDPSGRVWTVAADGKTATAVA